MGLRVVVLIILCYLLSAAPTLNGAPQAGRIAKSASPGAGGESRPPDMPAYPPPILMGIPSKPIRVGKQTKFLPDLALLDQNGQKVRFYSDLVKDKRVLISFFYTTCAYICLMQGQVLSDLQTELGNRLGKDVYLISVTMDPETDTPERLKAWAKQHGLRKGWTLVTGGKTEMAKLVGHLTGNPLGRIEQHSSLVYIGNDKTNTWIATYGLAAPKTLMQTIEEM